MPRVPRVRCQVRRLAGNGAMVVRPGLGGPGVVAASDPGVGSRGSRSGGVGPCLPAAVPDEVAGDAGGWEAAQGAWMSGDGECDLLEQRLVPTPEVFKYGVPGLGRLGEAVDEELCGRGVLLEVGEVVVDGLPGVRVVSKQRDPVCSDGLAGVGVLVVPRHRVTVVLRVTCRAGTEVWQRRTIEVFTLAVRDGEGSGGGASGWPGGWSAGMLGAGDQVVACPADAPEWDAMFPRHPVSRVRRHLGALAAGVRLSAEFRARPSPEATGSDSAGSAAGPEPASAETVSPTFR